MNSVAEPDRPEVIDLDPASVTEHDEATGGRDSGGIGIAGRKLMAGPPLAIAAVALAMGLIGGGWAYRDFFWRYLPNTEVGDLMRRTEAVSGDNALLKEKLAALERLSAQLKADIDANEAISTSAERMAQAATGSFDSLKARMDGIAASSADNSKRIDALDSRMQGQAAAGGGGVIAPPPREFLARLEALEKDVASLKAQQNQTMADERLLSQSLSELKNRILAGQPFRAELGRLNGLLPGNPDLDGLSQYAEASVADAKSLASELASLASALPSGKDLQAVAPPDGSWTGWALDRLSGLITIRLAGAVDWRTAAQASAAFAESGNLAQAAAHLQQVTGERPPEIERWLEKANVRLAVDMHLRSIEEAVALALAAKG